MDLVIRDHAVSCLKRGEYAKPWKRILPAFMLDLQLAQADVRFGRDDEIDICTGVYLGIWALRHLHRVRL